MTSADSPIDAEARPDLARQFQDAAQEIAAADIEARLRALEAQALRLAPLVANSDIDEADALDKLKQIAATNGLCANDRMCADVDHVVRQGLRGIPTPMRRNAETTRGQEQEEDVGVANRGTSTGTKKADAKGLTFTLFVDIKPEAMRKDWLVADLLGKGEVSCFFGPPGAGKSGIVVDLGAHVAAGRAWFGRRVSQGAVLIAVAERAELTKRRLAAFRLHHHVDDLPLAVVSGSMDLCSGSEHSDIIASYASDLHQKSAKKVTLIIIETVNRVLAGGDENSSRDMGKLIANIDRIQKVTGAHIILVHHIPASGAQRMRGHSSLLGYCDTTVVVENNRTARSARIDKVNDGPEGEPISFTFQSVELFTDLNTGQATTASVVVPVEFATADEYTGWPKKLLLLKQAVVAGLAAHGEMVRPVGEGPEVKAVKRQKLSADFCGRYVTQGGNGAKAKAFSRRMKDAQRANLISVGDINTVPYVWLTKTDEDLLT